MTAILARCCQPSIQLSQIFPWEKLQQGKQGGKAEYRETGEGEKWQGLPGNRKRHMCERDTGENEIPTTSPCWFLILFLLIFILPVALFLSFLMQSQLTSHHTEGCRLSCFYSSPYCYLMQWSPWIWILCAIFHSLICQGPGEQPDVKGEVLVNFVMYVIMWFYIFWYSLSTFLIVLFWILIYFNFSG